MSKHKILIVDDEVENLNLLRRTFINSYSVVIANSGEEAVEIVNKKSDISLIISDQRMPGMSGTEFFKVIEEKNPDIIKILLTAYTDVKALVEAINDGKVYKYVTKPWDPEDLKITVKRAIEVYSLIQENKLLLKDLTSKNIELKKLKDFTEERIEEERLRISRELHDDTCQSLASLNLNMEVCLKILKSQQQAEKINDIIDNITKMKDQLKATSSQVRRISMDLRPAELDSLGFISTIEQFVNRYKEQPNTPKVSIKIEGNIVTLPQKLELTLFRIIQECLNNIKKHAKASHVDINIAFNNDVLDIHIKDNGKGFQVPSSLSVLLKDAHLGLIGMSERIKQFNGLLEINSEIDQGTTIHVIVGTLGGTY